MCVRDRDEADKAEALALKEKLDQLDVKVIGKGGSGGRLFGSITSQDIAQALQKLGYEIDKKKIELKNPIKEKGTTKVPVRIYPEVVAQMSVTVTEE